MYGRTLLCIGLLVLPPAVSRAGDAALDRGTLRGLKALTVVIDRLDPQLQQEGLALGDLQHQVEGRLRHAGITVDGNAVEFLGLRILATRVKKGPYSLCVMIGLYQPVTLSRDKEIRTATQTWEAATILIAPPKQLIPASSDAADQLVDQFINAYRSVNPQ